MLAWWVGLVLSGCSCGQTTVVVPNADRGAPPQLSAGTTLLAPAPRPKTFALTPTVPAGFPDYRAPGNVRIDLVRTAARVSLPQVALPPKVAAITDQFVLTAKEMPNPKGTARVMTVVQAPLPFPVSTDETTFKPEEMTVRVRGDVIPFGRGPAHQAARPSWRISKNGKQLVLSLPDVPADGELVVTWPGVLAALERHDPAAFRGSSEEYVRGALTLGGDTRHGLMMVAPTQIAWEIDVPPHNPVFEAWLALEAPPVERPKSDGATVVLTARVDGKDTVLDRRDLDVPGDFERWRVDLSAFAGRHVTLQASCEPNQTPIFDWVFLGSPAVSGSPDRDVRRVVVVAMDTTRPDHFSFFGYGRDTTSELDRVLAHSATFGSAWSTAPRTRPSFRSSTTGRLPLEAVGATNIGRVFQEHGFATAGIVANVHLQPRFHFDDGFDWWSFDGTANAAEQVDRGLEWLRANADHDAYLFLHFMDPHMAYDAPPPYRNRYVQAPTLPRKIQRNEVLDLMAKGTLTPGQRAELEALHDGEMAYTSAELGRFFTQLDALPGRTLVVLHSDHGEEFWEHDGFEHNHSLYDELVRTVLAFRPGRGLPQGVLSKEPVSLLDIAPTLYDLFGFEDAPEVDGKSLVAALGGGPAPERPLPIGYLQYSHERWGAIWQGQKYILHTGTGREELYDLAKDPAEKLDLHATVDLAAWRKQTALAHGVPIGPGFRIAVDVPPGSPPLTVTLPAAALRAEVLDPEAVVEHRANIEWGETPKKLPSDVGSVALAADDRSFVFTPGPVGQGILVVLFDAPQDPAAVQVTRDGKAVAASPGTGPRPGKCPGEVCIDAGTVVIPPETEASRMGLAPDTQKPAKPEPSQAGGDDLEMLCKLGYVTEGCEKFGVAPPSDDDHGTAEPDAEDPSAPRGDEE